MSTGDHHAGPDDLSCLNALADPIRRRLYEYVANQHGPVRRDDAAASVGISRTLAAYHLDRLAEVGLLTTSYARPAGQTGPGAGRPAKRYERTQDEVSVSVPPRTYGLLARLLADAVESDQSGTTRAALMTAAEEEGRTTSVDDAHLLASLERRGYEPVVNDGGDIDLRNCPFHQLALRQRRLVCGLNHALLRGILDGQGENPDRAELAARSGYCCVVIHGAAQARRK